MNYFFSFLGNKNYVPFIILTRSRTGSNLLVDYLNSHAQIFVRSEIFRHLHGREYQAVLRRVYRKQPRFIKAVGFKIFYRHPFDAPDSGLWNFLEQDRAIRVIHLTRNNILRSIVSHRIADKIDIWFQKRKTNSAKISAAEKKIRLDFNELQAEFAQTVQWQLDGRERFREHPVLNITYEELVRNPESAFAEICGFLGVPYRKPASAFMKQNPENLQDLIGNYAELRDGFRGSRWEVFFEEK